MSRYYFNLVLESRVIFDREGLDVRDGHLQRSITRIVEELRSEEPELFEVGPGWSLEVVDDEGRELAKFPLQD